MLLNQEINLHMNDKLLKKTEFDGFVTTLKETLSALCDKAPSDSHMNVDVSAFETGYKIVIRLASSALDISESAVAQSPFSALDKALLKLRRALEFWAVQKKQQN